MELKVILPMIAAFILSAILCPAFLPLLKKLKFGQQVREEGNPEHLKKQGTPTMGGLAFLSAFIVAAVVFMLIFPEMMPTILAVLFLTVTFGIIGFIDDFLKVVKKQSEGFKAWQKLLCQIVVTGAFAFYMYKTVGTEVIIPFAGGKTWNMGWLYIPFVFLCVLGTDNGTNFTDGIDGLCSSVTTVVSLFFMLLAAKLNPGVSAVSGMMAGALMGFLLINSHPAKAFMGDTGSLALGGFVSAVALSMQMGWFVLLFGLIYLVEVVSVILQVGYFKLTHGKRLFKMAPIHHHFELIGFSETQIVALFTIITVILSWIAYIAL